MWWAIKKMQEDMQTNNEEIVSLTHGGSHVPLKVYTSRWYILTIFTIFCIMQSSMWGFFSPIQAPLEQLYGWDDAFIEWLGNAANITFCVLVIPLGAAVSGERGMRAPLLVTIVALCFNSGLRCIPVAWVTQNGYDVVSMLSMICNGIAGTLEALSPPVLAALWFPVQERAMATAIMAGGNTLGSALGFSIAFVVPYPATNDQISTKLTQVFWSFLGICLLTLLMMLLYFPSKPPTPPALSCQTQKVAIVPGIVALMKHGRYWVVAATMAIPLGVYAAWLNVLDISLKHFDFSQTDAGWIGFSSTLSGGIAGMIAGRVADKMPGRLARIIAIMYVLATLCMIWFSLICLSVIPYSIIQVYVSTTLVGVCMYSTYPLFFELSIETAFLVPEACTSAFLVLSQSVIISVFLSLPVGNGLWMNYVIMICTGLCAVVLLFLKEEYSRLHMDLMIKI